MVQQIERKQRLENYVEMIHQVHTHLSHETYDLLNMNILIIMNLHGG